MKEALVQLLDTLELEKIDDNIYRGQTPETHNKRAFGGQVFAQAMLAAQDIVSGEGHDALAERVLSAPGNPSVPIGYEDGGIREGRSFTTRRVVTSQRGRAIFNTELSFQLVGSGFSHQAEMPTCVGQKGFNTTAFNG